MQGFPTCHLLDMLCIVPIQVSVKCLTSLTRQLFYLHRAYVINKRAKWIPVVTIPLM